MRRPFALALASLLSALLLAVPNRLAAAQEPPVRFTLLEQTPWNRPDQPVVTIRVRAENTGQEPIHDLRIGITLWPPVFSRTGFEASLDADPADAAALLAETRRREGTLAPDEVRDFEIPIELPLDQLSPTQSLIYPLKIDLRSGYASLAAIRTPVIYLVRQPQYPLNLAWTFVLHSQLVVGADGVFGSPALETSISRGGRLAGQIAALAHVAASGAGVDVAISPTLLLQLQQMRDGYAVDDGGSIRKVAAGEAGSAAAAAAIDTLRKIVAAPNVEPSSLPYAEPLLPALTSGGLGRDLGVQLQRGREVVTEILGRAPESSILRPPRSALDEASLDQLPGQGVSTLLLDPATVPRAEGEQGFAPPPVVSLAAQNATFSAVVADPSVQALLASARISSDPVLGAQAALGELAAIWLQQPGERRGLAMTLGEDLLAPASFFGPLVRGVADAPWLTKRTASGLVDDTEIPRTDGAAQIVPAFDAFSPTYVDQIKQARRRVEIYRSMLVEPSDRPAQLDQLLLLAESQGFVGNEPAGLTFVSRVTTTVGSIFDAVRPQVSQPITLTSSAIRDVPIAIENAADVPLRVTIRLVSPHLRTPVEQSRVLDAASTETVTLDLELKTTGRFPVELQIVAPSGRVIGRAIVVVRSTAYNRIALMITIGAGMLALLVWSRRFLPRRMS